MAKIPAGLGPKYLHVVVIFGATGDLARRKLLPGLFRLSTLGFHPRTKSSTCVSWGASTTR
jgi:glucose-6-phosphate 1-dehydrogenase